MRLPDRPRLGLVLSYSYLWANEFERGSTEGLKDRPCAIVLATRLSRGGEVVYVVPITHQSQTPTRGLRMPTKVERRLGLDQDPSWIIVTELNAFLWPGPDLRTIRSERGGPEASTPCFYGVLPRDLFDEVKKVLAVNHQAGAVRVVRRTR